MPDSPAESTPIDGSPIARWEWVQLLAHAVILFVLAQWRLRSSPLLFRDQEELHSAAATMDLWQLDRWPEVFSLQYFPFCGGCTVDSVLGVPLFAALGPSLATWKLLAIGVALVGLVCWWALGRYVAGPVGGVAAAATWLFASPVLSDLRLFAWGNHVEVISLAPVAFLLAAILHGPDGRWRLLPSLALGAVVALGVWISFAWLYVVAGAGLIVLVRARSLPSGRVLGALGVGLLLGGIPWTVHHLFLHPFESGWLLFDDDAGSLLSRFDPGLVPRKLGQILSPAALAQATYGRTPPDVAGGSWPVFGLVRLGALLAGLAVGARRIRSAGRQDRWLVVALPLLAFVCAYCLSGQEFQVFFGDGGDIYEPVQFRYLVPALVLLPMAAMLAVAGQWGRDRRGLFVLGVLLLVPSTIILLARLGPGEGQLGQLQGYHLDWYEQNRGQLTHFIAADSLAGCEGPLCESLARRSGLLLGEEAASGHSNTGEPTQGLVFPDIGALGGALADGIGVGLARHWQQELVEEPWLTDPEVIAKLASVQAKVPEQHRDLVSRGFVRQTRYQLWLALTGPDGQERTSGQSVGAYLGRLASIPDGELLARSMAHSAGHALVADRIMSSWANPNFFGPAFTVGGGRQLPVEEVSTELLAVPSGWREQATRGAGAAAAEVLGCLPDKVNAWAARLDPSLRESFRAGAAAEQESICLPAEARSW